MSSSTNNRVSDDGELAKLWKLQTSVNGMILDGKRLPGPLNDFLQRMIDGDIGMMPVIPSVSPVTVWTVDNEGNTHFTVTSNGMTHEQWEKYLESRGFRLSDWARNVLRRASEAPTNGVAYPIVVRPGSKISSRDRITKKIRAHATEKGWKTPHWEVACLIRDTFTDEQLEKMGLWWIVTMHEPITDSGGDPSLLHSDRSDDGRWLYASYGRPGDRWDVDGGFAFEEVVVGV